MRDDDELDGWDRPDDDDFFARHKQAFRLTCANGRDRRHSGVLKDPPDRVLVRLARPLPEHISAWLLFWWPVEELPLLNSASDQLLEWLFWALADAGVEIDSE
jgi:hypothetical protein